MVVSLVEVDQWPEGLERRGGGEDAVESRSYLVQSDESLPGYQHFLAGRDRAVTIFRYIHGVLLFFEAKAESIWYRIPGRRKVIGLSFAS